MASGNSVIGALRVVLGIDSASLDKGLKDAQGSLAAFGATMAKTGVAAAAAFGAATIALGVSIQHAIKSADELGKSAQKIGIPVEELSALKHAADLSGISMGALEKGVGKLSKAMVEAAAKPTGEAADSFKALGIAATNTDGSLKSSSQVMTEVAAKFEGLKDGAGKTAIAMRLFGKAGADMIPLLNSGKAGLAGMIQEASELGIVIDNKTAKAAEAFNDNLTRLGKVYDGLILKITAEMLPAFLQFSQVMIDASKNSQLVKDIADGIVTGLKTVVSVVVQTVTIFQRLGAELKAFAAVAQSIGNLQQMKAAWAAFQAEGEKTKETFATMNTFVERFWTDAAAGAEKAAPKVATGLKDINVAALGGKNALDKFIETTQKSLLAQQAETATMGLAAGAKDRLRIATQAYTVAQQAGIVPSEAMRLKITELGIAAEQTALKLNGASLIQQSMPAWQQYTQQVNNAKLALDAIGATAEQKSLVLQKMAVDAGATWEQQSANMAGSFSQLADVFGKKNREMAIAAKALAIVQAVINSYMAYTKALASLPPPFNFVAAGAALASGLAAVATIASQSIPAAKHGMSMRVPGGVGGGDTKMFQAMVEPGEQIDITPNGSRGSDVRRGSGAGTSITLNIANAFTREAFGQIIRGINEATADGYRLNVAPV